MTKDAQTNTQTKRQMIKVGKYFRELVTVFDQKGNILHKVINPLMLEFRARDAVQIMVGAIILAIPVGFTEEVWNLGGQLPSLNILALFLASLLLNAIFVYYNYYRGHLTTHRNEFFKRVLSVYIISFIVVGVFMYLINAAPWATDWALALKRTVIVTFPASMSAAVVDLIK